MRTIEKFDGTKCSQFTGHRSAVCYPLGFVLFLKDGEKCSEENSSSYLIIFHDVYTALIFECLHRI